jgi:hypothetical protein
VGVIDDDSVVDVVVDDIVWRRRNVFWRVDPDRYRNINRNRKNIFIHRRWRWSQIHERGGRKNTGGGGGGSNPKSGSSKINTGRST